MVRLIVVSDFSTNYTYKTFLSKYTCYMRSEMGDHSVNSVLPIGVLLSMEELSLNRIFCGGILGIGYVQDDTTAWKAAVGKIATHVVTQSSNWLLQNNV